MLDTAARIVVVIVGLLFMAVAFSPSAPLFLRGETNFVPMYVAAKIVGGPDLYNPEVYYQFMAERFGSLNPSLVYCRLPYYAALLWPLGLLSYGQAAVVWLLYAVTAFGGFIALLHRSARLDALAFSAFYVPLFAVFGSGQDTTVVLFLVMLAVRLEERGRDIEAGVAFSFCAIKPHLLVLLPLLLLVRRKYRVLAGGIAGGIAFLALSTFVAGRQWPIEFWALLNNEAIHPMIKSMPNLNGLTEGFPEETALLVILSSALVAACGVVFPHVSFRFGVQIVLLGSLLVCYHSFLPDCVVLLPLLLDVLATAKQRWLRWLTVGILAPPLTLVSLLPRPYPYLLQIALVVYLAALVYTSLRSSRGGPEPLRADAPDPAGQPPETARFARTG